MASLCSGHKAFKEAYIDFFYIQLISMGFLFFTGEEVIFADFIFFCLEVDLVVELLQSTDFISFVVVETWKICRTFSKAQEMMAKKLHLPLAEQYRAQGRQPSLGSSSTCYLN